MGTGVFRPATAEEIRETFGADPGSLGPVGLTQVPILADQALEGRRNMVCGANKDDFHLKDVTPDKDFSPTYHSLREVESGDRCVSCQQPLEVAKTLEIGHIFKLGYKYSESMGATVLTDEGKTVPMIMGSYGIGLERILVAAVELYHDDAGIVWPRSIAPFQAIVTLLRPEEVEQQQAAQGYYEELTRLGIDCLLDDRKERPGAKFKDAELIGIPVRITVGNKLSQGIVEVFSRKEKTLQEVSADEAVQEAVRMLDAYPI